MSSAPQPTIAAFFSTLLPLGAKTVTRTPWRRAAKGMLWPWLPRVAVTMRSGNCPLRWRWSKYTSPPRTLKAPMGVWFSCFSQTSQPARRHSPGQRYCGVAGITADTTFCACSRSDRVNMTDIGSGLRRAALKSAPSPAMIC